MRSHPSRLLPFLLLLALAPLGAQDSSNPPPPAQAASQDFLLRVNEAVRALSTVPATGRELLAWRDDVEKRVKELGLPAEDQARLKPFLDKLSAAVSAFDPVQPAPSWQAVRQSSANLAAALADLVKTYRARAEGLGRLEAQLRQGGDKFQQVVSQLEALKTGQAGQQQVYDNLRAAGASEEVLQAAAAAGFKPAGEASDASLPFVLRQASLRTGEIPAWVAQAERYRETGNPTDMLGAPILEAGSWLVSSLGLDAASRELERLALENRAGGALSERQRAMHAFLKSLPGGDAKALSEEYERITAYKSDSASRPKALADWLQRAEVFLTATRAGAAGRYRDLLRRKRDALTRAEALEGGEGASEALQEAARADQELAELRATNPELARWEQTKSAHEILAAAAAVPQDGALIGLPGAGLAVKAAEEALRPTQSGTAEAMAKRLETVPDPWAAAAPPAQGPGAPLGAKLADMRRKLGEDLARGSFWLSEYELRDREKELEALPEEARGPLKPYLDELKFLSEAGKLLKDAKDQDEAERLVAALAARLRLGETAALKAKAEWDSSIARSLSYDSKADPEKLKKAKARATIARYEADFAAALAAGGTMDFERLFDNMAQGKGDYLLGDIPMAELERADPARFYALAARFDAGRRGLAVGDQASLRDSAGARRYDAALAKLAEARAGAPGSDYAENPGLSRARFAFFAALSESPLAALAGRRGLEALRRDFQMEKVLRESDGLIGTLPDEERKAFEARRGAALSAPDPFERDRLLRAWSDDLRGALRRGPMAEQGDWEAKLRDSDKKTRELYERMAAEGQAGPGAYVAQRLKAIAASGRAPEPAEFQRLLEEAREQFPERFKEIEQALREHQAAQQGLQAFEDAHPGYRRFQEDLDRHAASVGAVFAAGLAPRGARYELTMPDGTRAVLEDAPAMRLDGEPFLAQVRGQGPFARATGSADWQLHGPKMMLRLSYDPWGLTTEERQNGVEMRGVKISYPDGKEEFRSYDGRLSIVTVVDREKGKTKREYVVDGIAAGSSETVADPREPGKTITRVSSVIPGFPNIIENGDSGEESATRKRGQVRLDDIIAAKDSAESARLLGERVEEIARYIESPMLSGEDASNYGGARVDRELLRAFLAQRLAARGQKTLALSLSKGYNNASAGISFYEEEPSSGWVYAHETGINPNSKEITVGVSEYNRNSKAQHSFATAIRRVNGSWEYSRTMIRYVEQKGWFVDEWGEQPHTDVYDLDPRSGALRSLLRTEKGEFKKDTDVDTFLWSALKNTGKGIVGVGQTVWYGAVGTGKLIVGGASYLVSDRVGAMFVADGMSQFAANPLSRSMALFYGKIDRLEDMDEAVYRTLSANQQRALQDAEIGNGDWKRSMAVTADAGGVLYDWGGKADSELARGLLYLGGAAMDFGKGTTEMLPLMFAGHLATGVSRTLSFLPKVGTPLLENAAAIGNATNRAVGLGMLGFGGYHMKDLPEQIRNFDWSKPETVRPVMAQASNLLFMYAGAKLTKGTGMEISKDLSKPMGLDQGAFSQFGRVTDARAAARREFVQNQVVAQVRRQAGDEAAKLATEVLKTDSLTGLINKGHIDGIADGILLKLAHEGKIPMVAIMDMNNFGAVNDGLAALFGDGPGRRLADGVLREVGAKMQTMAKEFDVTVARYGGEEIVLVGSRENVLAFVQRVQHEFQDGSSLTALIEALPGGQRNLARRAIYEALIKKRFKEGTPEHAKALEDLKAGRAPDGQPIGDFTIGLAEARGRGFSQAIHAADLALKHAKDTGKRGGVFQEMAPGQFKALARRPLPVETPSVGMTPPRDLVAQVRQLEQSLGAKSLEFQRFLEQAFKDPLTNTRTPDYIRYMETEWAARYGQGTPPTVAAVSSKGLKILNDALGHADGDAYLRALGQRLRAELYRFKKENPGADVSEPIRVGSKDFVFVGKDAWRAAQRVMASMEKDSPVSLAQREAIRTYRDTTFPSQNGGQAHPDLTPIGKIGGLRGVQVPLQKSSTGLDLTASLDAALKALEDAKKADAPAVSPPSGR